METADWIDHNIAGSSAPLPTGTLTFLFSDIEGSSHLWEQAPEAMRTALANHDTLLREQVATHGGQIVKARGDGFHAVFARASDGVAAALAGQRALQGEAWDDLPQPLRVRMGLHTGEAELRQGDYYGPAVNRAARLAAVAAGGQILLSATSAELARATLPQGASLRDLGDQRLRDLSRPERVYQLNGPGLIESFPALRSLNTLPNNLPLQLTSFIGREHEIAETQRLLADTRLLSLIGPGGTGKTRLALQVAAEALEDYPAGAWWVELAPLADPGLVPQAVAGVLGVREQQGRPVLDSLVDYLRPKHLLLILDNCEHLVEACARLVASLLSACPRLKILGSSREALGIAGETALRVPSLSLPDPENLNPEVLLQSEAVRLFEARAKAIQPAFELTARNAKAVAQICQRLDGIPLALELAAGRVRLLSVDQIAARLDDRFRLLTGGSRTALPRQQTLRALIDWSYDLLEADERTAFRALSVFAGGWAFDAAEALLGPDALDLLALLVDKSLVVVDEPGPVKDSGSTVEPRYRLLETIRQYARDKLLESGESQAARDRHLEIYLQLAIEAEPNLEGSHMQAWLDRLGYEVDNFRAALEWGLDRNPEAALQIVTDLRLFWQIRVGLIEGRNWLNQCLERFDTLKPDQEDELRQWQSLRAQGLAAAGSFAFALGELIAARSFFEESAALAREAGELRILGSTLGLLGMVNVWLGDADAAEAVIAEGLGLSQATNDPRDWTSVKMIQANAAGLIYGDSKRSIALIQEIIQLRRDELVNPWLLGLLYLGMGGALVSQGDDHSALRYFELAEAQFRKIEARPMICAMQSERGHIARRAGNYAQALDLYAITITCWQELGGLAALAHELECFAFIAVAREQSERAARLLGAAEVLREAANTPMRNTERPEYDGYLTGLRRQLDGEQLSSAWSAGRSMTVEQAVDFALEEINN